MPRPSLRPTRASFARWLPPSHGGSLLGRDGALSVVDGGNRVFEFNSRSGCQCSAPNGRVSTTGVASLLGVLLGVASTRRRRRRD